MQILNITRAQNAVITTSVSHRFEVGDQVKILCSDAFHMREINNLTGRIMSTTQFTVTIDIDSRYFTAFAFPTSAEALAGITFPQIIPVGTTSSNILSSQENIAVAGMRLGASVVGNATNVMYWKALG